MPTCSVWINSIGFIYLIRSEAFSLVGVSGMIKGAYKKFMAIDSKFFDSVVKGRCEDVLRITENDRDRRERGSLFSCLRVLLFGC